MSTDLVVAQLSSARSALVKAETPSAVKLVMDVAEAAKVYAQRQKLGAEVVGRAVALQFDAEKRLGEMLKGTPKNKGTRAAGGNVSGGTVVVPPDATPTLAEIGIDKKTSARAQKLDSLPDDVYEKVRSGDLSVTQATRAQKAQAIARAVSLPDAKYRVIYADPPWSYGNTQPDYHTEQRDHYPVMPLKDICALPIASIAEDNAALFLWVTSPILEESFQVIKAWGFKYKAAFVWDKVKHNMGHYNSVRHELLLICTRGSGVPEVPKLYDSVVTQERGAHSAKPTIFYDMIETLYPSGKKIELFARGERSGWDGYGHQADSRAT